MRWRRYETDNPEARDDALVLRLVDRLEPWLERWYRPDVRGLEGVPDEPVLFVGNHSGGMATPDTWLLAVALTRSRGVRYIPHGLGHDKVLRAPVFNQILVPLGAVRASRENALRLFASGRNALVYPGGDADSMRPFSRRDEIIFDGRRGYVRLALEAGVPIMPVVAAGSHATMVVLTEGRGLAKLLRTDRLLRAKVWPVALCLPWGVAVGATFPYVPVPTTVLIDVLEPIRFDRSGPDAAGDDAYVDACDAEVRSRMQASLTRLAAERREAPSALRRFFEA